jgi:hypothetical protein
MRETLDAQALELAERGSNHHVSVRKGAAGNPALL